MKVLLIANESNSVCNFRKDLILFLRKQNAEVYVIASDKKRETEILALGVVFRLVEFSNRSKNPFQFARTKRRFRAIITEIAPDIVMTFQIKPNIIGALAAHKAGVKNIFCMIEGLGDPFQPANLRGRIVRFVVSRLYRKSLVYAKKVFVLNDDDRAELIKRHIVLAEKLVLIPGIGINTSQFAPDFAIAKEKKVIKMARLIRNKGILDYCETARLVRRSRPDIVFELFGEESELKIRDIQGYIDDGSILFRGYCHNPSDEIKKARVVASASYREGFPRVVLEAMALGRVVVAYNVIGNRDAINNGETGFLIGAHDINAFAHKLLEIIDDDKLLKRMGQQARRVVEERYDSLPINKMVWEIVTKNSTFTV